MVQGLVDVIGRRESSGQKDPYRAIGVPNKKGQKAYGKYQVMDFNIPTWTKEILGRPYTVEEFLNNPAAQDKVAQTRLAQYKQQTGSDADAASMWFSGQPQAKAGNAADVLGTTTNQYVSDVMGNMNGASLTKATPQRNAVSGAGSVSTSKSRQDKLKENIDAMVKQGGSQQQIQGYIDSLGKSGGSQQGNGYVETPPYVPKDIAPEIKSDNRDSVTKLADMVGLHNTNKSLRTNLSQVGNFLDPRKSLDQKVADSKSMEQPDLGDSVKSGLELSTYLGAGAGAKAAAGGVKGLVQPLATKAGEFMVKHPFIRGVLKGAIDKIAPGLIGGYIGSKF